MSKMPNMSSCPICQQKVEPFSMAVEHLETHRLGDQTFKQIGLHIMKLEDRLNALESKG
jgi:hypothetical protein